MPLDGESVATRADTIISVSAAPLGGYAFSTEPMPVDERRSSQIVTLSLNPELGSLEISNGPTYGSDILRSVAVAWAVAGILSIALACLGRLAGQQTGHATRSGAD